MCVVHEVIHGRMCEMRWEMIEEESEDVSENEPHMKEGQFWCWYSSSALRSSHPLLKVIFTPPHLMPSTSSVPKNVIPMFRHNTWDVMCYSWIWAAWAILVQSYQKDEEIPILRMTPIIRTIDKRENDPKGHHHRMDLEIRRKKIWGVDGDDTLWIFPSFFVAHNR